MATERSLMGVLAVGAVIVCFCISSSRQSSATPAAGSGAPRWEYKIVDVASLIRRGPFKGEDEEFTKRTGIAKKPDGFMWIPTLTAIRMEAEFNRLGEEGWELITHDRIGKDDDLMFPSAVYVFRRLK